MITLSRSIWLLAAALMLAVSPALAQQQQQRPPAQQRPAAPAAQPAPAQPAAEQALPPKNSNIVVVDLLAVERDSQAFKSIRTQIDRRRATQQTEITKLEGELRAAEEELTRQRTVLSPEAYNQRRRDLEKRIGDAQQSVQTRRRDLEQAFGDAGNRVMTNVQQIILEVAEENQYQVVLPKSQVIAVRGALDITGEVLRRLNQKMPTVNVAAPAAAPAAR